VHAYAASKSPLQKTSTQSSKLLPSLFGHIDEGETVTVFHVGPALPETVDFFSSYRCKLHFIDLFSELPLVTNGDSASKLHHPFEELLEFPPDTRFDICLFWDLFNYLNVEAIHAFMTALRPYLKTSSLAHVFSVHNLKADQDSHLYSINQLDTLSFRSRRTALPGYAPHSQSRLKELLHCFTLERSVLLADSRLELLLQARL
jgi:hypothetical protein